MKKIRIVSVFADYWWPALATLVCGAIFGSLLLFRLGSLTPGLAATEIQTKTSATTLQKIVDNPLYLHEKSAQLALEKSNHNGKTAVRLPNIMLGAIAVACMFLVLKNWHTRRVSVAGTMLFATSSWFLHTSRLASSDMAYVMPITLVLGAIWLHSGRNLRIATALTVVSAVLLMYVPGMVWFVLPAIIWQRRVLKQTVKRLSIWWQAIVVTIVIVGIAPLVWGLINSPDLVTTWLGAPAQWPSPIEFLKNIANVPLELFIRRELSPVDGVGRLPYLEAFTAAMVLLGLFAYGFRLRLDRTRFILGLGVIGTLLIALKGPFAISFLLPLVYIVAAAGIALLLQQWFTVFPRNPFARTVGVIVISAGVLMACFYHLNRYFVAWPNAPETKAVVNLQPDIR